MTSQADVPDPDLTKSDPADTPPPPPPPISRPGTSTHRKTLDRSRTGYTWIGLIVAALIGILVLVFILQNLERQRLELLFWEFSMPIGILVLLAVIAGALVMALVGGIRIVQLRRAARR